MITTLESCLTTLQQLGEFTYFLGLQIKQDDKGISICQEQYTRNLLKKYEISNSSSVKTLMVPPNIFRPDLARKPINKTLYRGMIGLLMEFWSTDVAYDSSPPTDETEQRPLREYLIKFSVLNGQQPLTLDFNTFCSLTGLDYKNGKYVGHLEYDVVKKELGKIAINPTYLDKTLV
ncbi:hypothetical protein Tco_0247932 [Tanacetum coccineum]